MRNYRKEKITLSDLPDDYIKDLKVRIEINYKEAPNGCWEWQKGCFPNGYGKVSVKGHSWGVHRVYYQLTKGVVDKGLVMSHLCDNPPCINPSHLEATTQWENNARGVGLSAQNLRKTHCKHGHQFTEENTKVRIQNGHSRRECRKCNIYQDRERKRKYAKQRAAQGLTTHGTVRVRRYKNRLPKDKI